MRRQLRSAPHIDGAIRGIRDAHVIGHRERHQISGHDGGRVEVRPERAVFVAVVRLSPRRHVRQGRVVSVMLYGDIEGGFQRWLVPTRERASRPSRLEMRCSQPPAIAYRQHPSDDEFLVVVRMRRVLRRVDAVYVCIRV